MRPCIDLIDKNILQFVQNSDRLTFDWLHHDTHQCFSLLQWIQSDDGFCQVNPISVSNSPLKKEFKGPNLHLLRKTPASQHEYFKVADVDIIFSFHLKAVERTLSRTKCGMVTYFSHRIVCDAQYFIGNKTFFIL